jgi:hypothetical protein
MKPLETTIREKDLVEGSLEAHNLHQIEDFVRLGLLPIMDLPLLKRALAHVQTDIFLPFPERKVFYDFFHAIMRITLDDPTINRLTRQRISMRHGTMTAAKDPHVTVREGIDMHGTPEGTLVAYANAIKNKIRAGGKPTTNDKQLATQAKNELRRRRNVASKRGGDVKEDIELTFEQKLELAFERFEITGISELTPENKVAFFEYLDCI